MPGRPAPGWTVGSPRGPWPCWPREPEPWCPAGSQGRATPRAVGGFRRRWPRELLAAQDRASVHVQDFAGDEAGQVRGKKQNWPGAFVGGGHAAQRLLFADLFESFLVLEDGTGHVRIHPAGGHGVDEDVVRGELGGKAFDQADDGALGGAVVGMKGLAALAGGGADGNDSAGALVNHVGDAQVNDAVNAF